MDFCGSQTEKNLKKTFTGESKANTKYTLYAEKARSEGLHYVAQVFDETAFNELAHARRVFAEFLGGVNSTEENLMNAFMGETAEATAIYKEYEEVARKEGFEEIADFYKEVAEEILTPYGDVLIVDIYMKDPLHLWYVLFVDSLKDGLSHIVIL